MKLTEVLNQWDDWKKNPISLENWKKLVMNSHHVRRGEKFSFTKPNERGVIHASILVPHLPVQSIFVGAYFTEKYQEIEPGHGWVYQ